MANRLTELAIDFVSLVPRGADQDAYVMLAKSADPDDQSARDVPTTSQERTTMPESTITDEQRAAVAKAGVELTDEQIAALVAGLKPAETETAEGGESTETTAETGTEVGKAEAEAATETVAKADFDAVRKELDDIREERDIAKRAEQVRKDFAHLPVDAIELAGAMHRIDKGTPTSEDAALVARVLGAADAGLRLNAQLTNELGTATPADGTPEAAVAKIAKGIEAANPDLTPEQAYRQALNTPEGRAAYGESENERMLHAGPVVD